MNVADVLERAADVIDRRGHWTGNYVGDDGRVCALGAMAVSVGARDAHAILLTVTCNALVHLASDAFSEVLGDDWRVCTWNDAHTAAEVTSALRACAAVERARAAVAETVAETVTA